MKRAATPKDAESMGMIRLLGIVVIMVSLGGSAAFALHPIGPPPARAGKRQFPLGADFSLSQTALALSRGQRVTSGPPLDPPTGDPGRRTLQAL
nr:hypothetical protein [Planctomycetota bacterium]